MALPYPNPTNTAEWAKDFLTSIGAPLSTSNVGYVEAWEHGESPSGYGYNPLGTEERANNSTNANSAGVQAYNSWAEGIAATDATLAGYKGNASLVADLQKGNATFAQLSAAQQKGSWASGGESAIDAPGTSQNFTYGGTQGEQPGAPGIATSSSGVLGDVTNLFNPVGNNFLGSGSVANVIGGIPSDLAKSIFGPLVKFIEEGAADVTFVGFGLLLVVVGLVITFRGASSINVQAPTAPNSSGGATRDAKDAGEAAAIAA